MDMVLYRVFKTYAYILQIHISHEHSVLLYAHSNCIINIYVKSVINIVDSYLLEVFYFVFLPVSVLKFTRNL